MELKEPLWTKDFINISAATFLVACSFFLLMPTLPLYLSEHLQVSPSKIGVVLSSYAIALLVIRPFSGYLVDIYARKPLLLFGLTIFVSMYVGYYFAYTVMFFIVLRFFHGLFWGLSSVSANTIAIDVIPSSRRAEGIGYFGVNMNLAMAVAPFIAVAIYDSYGFNNLVTSALIMGILGIIVALLIHPPQRPLQDKSIKLSADRFILIKAVPIFLNQLFLSFGWGTLVAFAVLYGKEIGIQNAGIFFLFLASGLVISRITSGKFVDKGYLHGVIVLAILIISIGFISFSFFHNVYLYCLAAFILGIGFGSLFPALQTIYINMADKTQRGTANSTYLTGFDLGIGLGMLLGATIADYTGFSNMYLICGLINLIAMVIYWVNSRKVYERNKLV